MRIKGGHFLPVRSGQILPFESAIWNAPGAVYRHPKQPETRYLPDIQNRAQMIDMGQSIKEVAR